MGGEISNSNYEQELQQAQTEDKKVVLPEEMTQDNDIATSIANGEKTIEQEAISQLDNAVLQGEKEVNEIKDRLLNMSIDKINNYAQEISNKSNNLGEFFWLTMEKMKLDPLTYPIYSTLARYITSPNASLVDVYTGIHYVGIENGYYLGAGVVKGKNYKFINKIEGEITVDKSLAGIGKLFGNEVLEGYNRGYEIRNDDLSVMGYTDPLGNTALNLSQIYEFNGMSVEEVKQLSLNNELAHQILLREYGFGTYTKYDWSKVSIPDSSVDIANSEQVNTFISDVASVSTVKNDSLRIAETITSFYRFTVDNNGELTITEIPDDSYKNHSYNYTAGVMLEKVMDIIKNKNDGTYQKLLDQVAQHRIIPQGFFVENLSDSDLAQIQQKMLSQGKYLLSIIKDMKKEKTPA